MPYTTDIASGRLPKQSEGLPDDIQAAVAMPVVTPPMQIAPRYDVMYNVLSRVLSDHRASRRTH